MGAAESIPGLCAAPRDICAGPRTSDGRMGKSIEELQAEQDADASGTVDPTEQAHVVETVRTWLRLRETADANGAALLSTGDIMVRTPLGVIQGLDQVRAQIYNAASPMVESTTELVAEKKSAGLWHVHRRYVVNKKGTTFELRQDWLVVVTRDEAPRRPYKPLIAEVSSSIA